MEQASLDPAKSIIDRFGGADEVRKITGASRTRVYRWQLPKDQGGTDGRIPPKHAEKLLEHARETGIEVSAEEFFRVGAR
jgi:hypothetical protein